MTNLSMAILAHDLTGSAAEIVKAFGETVEVSRDATAYTWSGVNDRLVNMGVDPLTVVGWNVAVDALPGGSMLSLMLSSGGVDFTGPFIRQQLTAVKQVASPEVAEVLYALLSIGITMGPLWRKAGLSSLPTEAEVESALAEIDKASIVAQCQQSIAAKHTAISGWLASLDHRSMSVAEVRAYCDSLLASPDGNLKVGG